MLKKIETFLVIMLAICAVLLLLATGGRRGDPAAVQTGEPTAQTTAPDTQPETEPGTQPTAQPEPTQTTAAAAAPREQVEQILEQAGLVQTAVTPQAESTGREAAADAPGLAWASHGAALAELAEGMRMNPVAAFWELVSAGLYEKRTDDTGSLSVTALKPPAQAAKTYPFTDEGARQLLTDLLALAARTKDGLELETALLGANLTVEGTQVHWSEADRCHYAYFSCASDWETYILCFYLRGGEQIEDVEFQLLHLRHASGGAESLERMDSTANKQAASLMAAAELLMTGEHRAGEGEIPFSYEVGGMQASLERFEFTGDPDRGSLVNYRLRMK